MILRNCPLCGKNDFRIFEQGPARREENDMWFTDITEHIIECNNCGHQASGWSKDEAHEEWNTKNPDEWEIRWWNRKCGI